MNRTGKTPGRAVESPENTEGGGIMGTDWAEQNRTFDGRWSLKLDGKPRKQVVTIRLTEDEYDELLDQRKRSGMTITGVLVDGLRARRDEREKLLGS